MSQYTKLQSEQILKNQRETASTINALIEQSKDALLCGPDCQQSKTAKELEQKYLNAKMEMVKAPSDVENAKKNYYVFTEGEGAYHQMLEEELKQKAEALGELIRLQFQEEMKEAKTMNSLLNSDVINSKNTLELYKTYFINNEEVEKSIKNSQGDILTNDRKSYYENQEKDNLKGWYTVLLTTFYILGIFYFIQFILGNNNLSNIKKIVIAVIILIFPFIIDFLTRGFLTILKKIGEFLPKDVYLSN